MNRGQRRATGHRGAVHKMLHAAACPDCDSDVTVIEVAPDIYQGIVGLGIRYSPRAAPQKCFPPTMTTITTGYEGGHSFWRRHRRCALRASADEITEATNTQRKV
jgi:hypothetical protein